MWRKRFAAPVWAAVLLVLGQWYAAPAWAWSQCLAIDGDTLYCEGQKIRLTNVYAAEMNEAGGAAAKRRMAALIASGRVTLLRHGHDKYGRILAEVFVDGRRIEQADIGPRAGRGTNDPNARKPYYVARKRAPRVQGESVYIPHRAKVRHRHRQTHTGQRAARHHH